MSMFAFLLVQASPGTEQKIKSRIEGLPGVKEAHNTIGGWNVFVKLEVGERMMKNHAPRKPSVGRHHNANPVASNSPTITAEGTTMLDTPRATGHW